jgi:hypothetical protein
MHDEFMLDKRKEDAVEKDYGMLGESVPFNHN